MRRVESGDETCNKDSLNNIYSLYEKSKDASTIFDIFRGTLFRMYSTYSHICTRNEPRTIVNSPFILSHIFFLERFVEGERESDRQTEK